MRWTTLGDQAVLAYCDDEAAATRFAAMARVAHWPWLVDVVQAYVSVAVFFDPRQTDDRQTRQHLESLDLSATLTAEECRLHLIPVCYEKGFDLARIARYTGLEPDAVIQAHLDTTYTVYAIGFCPGFPYLGYLSQELAGVPRLESPRLQVPVGSVGLTGRQTGIYTESKPGGWSIIGQTPLKLVDVADNYFPLRTGDRVQFERIDVDVFSKRFGERLT